MPLLSLPFTVNTLYCRCLSHGDDKYTSGPSSVDALVNSYDSGIGSKSSSPYAYHVNVLDHKVTGTGSHSERNFTSDDHDLAVENSPLESYTDGQHNYYDLNHTQDLDGDCGSAITTAGHRYETFKTSYSLTNDTYKGVITRQCKRKKDSSPCLAIKKQQVVSQSLPANLIQGIDRYVYIYTYTQKEYL